MASILFGESGVVELNYTFHRASTVQYESDEKRGTTVAEKA